MEYYLANVNSVSEQVGFIGLTEEQMTQNQNKLEKLISARPAADTSSSR